MADREHSIWLAKSCLIAADSWRGKRKSFTDTSNIGKERQMENNVFDYPLSPNPK